MNPQKPFAGRKPDDVPRKLFAVQLAPQTIADIRTLAARKGWTIRATMEWLIARGAK